MMLIRDIRRRSSPAARSFGGDRDADQPST
jgi:hypothetical protein